MRRVGAADFNDKVARGASETGSAGNGSLEFYVELNVALCYEGVNHHGRFVKAKGT